MAWREKSIALGIKYILHVFTAPNNLMSKSNKSVHLSRVCYEGLNYNEPSIIWWLFISALITDYIMLVYICSVIVKESNTCTLFQAISTGTHGNKLVCFVSNYTFLCSMLNCGLFSITQKLSRKIENFAQFHLLVCSQFISHVHFYEILTNDMYLMAFHWSFQYIPRRHRSHLSFKFDINISEKFSNVFSNTFKVQ